MDLKCKKGCSFLRIHPLTTATFIVAIIIFICVQQNESLQELILGYIKNEPIAFATLALATTTAAAILKDSISKTFNRPIIKLVPNSIMEYPKDKNGEISVFAVLPPSGSRPTHIWIRLYFENQGRSVAKDVYAKIISVRRIDNGGDKLNSVTLTPFNPFKLRWVSLDKITEIKAPWYGTILKGVTVQSTVNGDLVKNESEYVNMCTFVGGYHSTDEKLHFCPVLVPGLPEDGGNGKIIGQGHVAGVNSDILKITEKKQNVNGKVESSWDTASFVYDIIVGGSNFKTIKRSFMVKCSISNDIQPSTEVGNYKIFGDIEEHVNLSIEAK